MSLIDDFLGYIGTLPDTVIYGCLALSAFVENLFPPIPGDTITAFGAFLVGTGRLHFLGVWAATTAGSLVGFMLLFRLGGFLGRRFFIERDYWFLKASDIVRAEAWFRKYGYVLMLMNRFLPGIRSAIAVVGGLSRLKAWAASLLALISISVWNLIWIGVGYGLGNNWEAVRARIERLMTGYQTAVLILFSAAACLLLLRAAYRRSKKKNSG